MEVTMNSFTRSVTIPVVTVLTLALMAIGCGSSSGGRPAIPADQVSEPSFDRPTGYFVDPVDVIITPAAADTGVTTVVLTTDGSDPSCGTGTAYASTTITVSATTTVKAVACKDGFGDSDLLEATYTNVIADTIVYSGAGLTPIQEAIDAAAAGDIIYLTPGEYPENYGQVVIDKPLTLIGAGSGDDATTDTIVTGAPHGLKPIYISAGGASATSRVAIRNLRVTGSLGTNGNDGGGIEIHTFDGHIEFDNLTVTGNSGNGIHFNISGTDNTRDIIIKNSDLSFNGNHGFRVPTGIDNIDGLVIDNTVFEGNVGAGIMFYNMGRAVAGSTNFQITNSTFIGNAAGQYQLGDIVFSGFNGNGTFSTVTIVGNASECGIRISGNKDSSNVSNDIAGDLTFSSLNISGVQQSYGSYPSAAILISRYLGLSNVTMSNVELGSTAPNGLFLGTINAAATTVTGAGSGPNLGDLLLSGTYSVADIKLGSHGNSGSYDVANIPVDGTGVTFQGAAIDADIENRVYHQVDDGALGLVSWTTP